MSQAWMGQVLGLVNMDVLDIRQGKSERVLVVFILCHTVSQS